MLNLIQHLKPPAQPEQDSGIRRNDVCVTGMTGGNRNDTRIVMPDLIRHLTNITHVMLNWIQHLKPPAQPE
jgi:hypothetical protein